MLRMKLAARPGAPGIFGRFMKPILARPARLEARADASMRAGYSKILAAQSRGAAQFDALEPRQDKLDIATNLSQARGDSAVQVIGRTR